MEYLRTLKTKNAIKMCIDTHSLKSRLEVIKGHTLWHQPTDHFVALYRPRPRQLIVTLWCWCRETAKTLDWSAMKLFSKFSNLW